MILPSTGNRWEVAPPDAAQWRVNRSVDQTRPRPQDLRASREGAAKEPLSGWWWCHLLAPPPAISKTDWNPQSKAWACCGGKRGLYIQPFLTSAPSIHPSIPHASRLLCRRLSFLSASFPSPVIISQDQWHRSAVERHYPVPLAFFFFLILDGEDRFSSISIFSL